jgi:putative ABC transport system permease protein
VGDELAAVEGVETVSPLRYTENEVLGVEGGGFLTLVDPATAPDVLELEWVDGSQETLGSLGPNDAVIDEQWGSDNSIGVGDEFQVRTATGEEITYSAAGSFTDDVDFIGDYAASDANASAYGEGTAATQFLLNLDDGADTTAARAEIDTLLDERFPTAQAQDNAELKDAIASEIDGLVGVVYALLLLAVIVSLFGIVNTLALSIHERTRELGLLRAVGTSRRQVRRIVRYEAVITALIGAVLGLVLGVVFAVLVSRPLADEGFQLAIPVGTLVGMLVLAVVAGILAAIGPARRASRLDVLEALAYE